MYSLLRSLLFCVDAEIAHHLSLNSLSILPQKLFPKVTAAPLKLWGLNFPNPVGLAAGLDKNGEYVDGLAKLGFGFIEVGTVTPKPQPGNPRPRIFRIPQQRALINRMGFNNKGVDFLITQLRKTKYHGILGINIGKNAVTELANAVEDYVICLKKVYQYASYIVINISSPNTPGLRELQYGDHLQQLITGILEAKELLITQFGKNKPLLLKISPDETPATLKQIAAIVLQYRLDGIIATNTSCAREDVENLKLAQQQGGLSGAPILNRSNQTIELLHELVTDKVPIIGVGGIDSADAALKKFAAGAKLIQLYTGLIYEGPGLVSRIMQQLPHNFT